MTEIYNLSTICRCCHSDGCFKSLNRPYQSELGLEMYETMLETTLGIRISQPPAPVEASYSICETCISKLRGASMFRQQVLACEQKFQVYCTNEQFLSGAIDDVKEEIDSVSSGCDQQNIDFDKQEITIEVDIKHPIVSVEGTERVIKDDLIKIEVEEINDEGKPIRKRIRKKRITEEVKEEILDNQNYKQDIIDEKREPVKKIIRKKETETQAGKETDNQNNERKITKNLLKSYIVQVKSKDGFTYSCKSCGGHYPTKQHVLKHVRLQHRATYKCHCGKMFKHVKSLERHKKIHLFNNTCKYCALQFANRKRLIAHEKIHTTPSLFQCDICNKQLKYKNTLRKHILEMHSDQKELLCDVCGRAFRQKSNLEAHIRVVHLNIRQFACTLCAKTYSAKKHLKNHIKIAHSNNPKPYECDVCGKSFACPKSLKIHRFTHDNIFTCRYCFLTFDNKQDRDVHVKTHDKNINNTYNCHLCGKVLKTKFTLNRHIELHSGIRKFACPCGMSFSQKSLLQRHYKRKHNCTINVEKTKCDICNRSYINIEKHRETHSKYAKKFFCDICGKGYSENNALNRHKNQKHYGISHDCELCGKKYVNKRSLQNHKFKVHKIKREVDIMSDDVELSNVT